MMQVSDYMSQSTIKPGINTICKEIRNKQTWTTIYTKKVYTVPQKEHKSDSSMVKV